MTLPSASFLMISAMSPGLGFENIFHPVRSLPLKSGVHFSVSLSAPARARANGNAASPASSIVNLNRCCTMCKCSLWGLKKEVLPLLLFGGGGRRGQFARLGSDFVQVGFDVRFDAAERPGQGAAEQFRHDLALPHVFAMAHRRVKDTAFAVLTRPGGRKPRPLVHWVFHALGVLHENDVQVRGEVLECIPFFVHLKIFLPLDAGKIGIDDAHPRFLLLAMYDELPAEHSEIRIDLIACLVSLTIARTMEGVAGAVAADEAFAASHGIEQRLLASARHGRRIILTLLAEQITLCLEQKTIEFGKLSRLKDTAVFLADDLDVVFLA